MKYNPISDVEEQKLLIDNSTINNLKELSKKPKLVGLIEMDIEAEAKRLNSIFSDLFDNLLNGIEENPSKLWVMKQFQVSLIEIEMEDTEVRESFGTELEGIMDILKIDSSDGLLGHYLE